MHESFLAAIRNEWGPFPILSYADWLEEQGDNRAVLLRTLAAHPQGFEGRLSWEDSFDAHGGQRSRVWVKTAGGATLECDDAKPVYQRFMLWRAEQALARERQQGRRIPQAEGILGTLRRWVRGAATREEFRAADQRAQETPPTVRDALLLAMRLDLEDRRSTNRGTLQPFDEFSLRLCSECQWQAATPRSFHLQAEVERHGPLSCVMAVRCLLQAARLLVRFHAEHGRHGDLRPRHLAVKGGAVAALLYRGTLTRQSHRDMPADCADYAAPDTARDSHDRHPYSDVYSLGCILCFLVLGHPPFPEGTLAQRLIRHQTEPPPNLWQVGAPPDLEAIYQRMTAKRHDDRYQTATELVAALEGWLRAHPTS